MSDIVRDRETVMQFVYSLVFSAVQRAPPPPGQGGTAPWHLARGWTLDACTCKLGAPAASAQSEPCMHAYGQHASSGVGSDWRTRSV